MRFKTIGGDFKGQVWIETTVMWWGAKAKYFTGLRFNDAKVKYTGADIKRVKMLSEQDVAAAGAGGAALAGGLLLGPVGAIATAAGNRKQTAIYGVEFSDGKKAILKREGPEDKFHQVFRNFVEENHLLEISF